MQNSRRKEVEYFKKKGRAKVNQVISGELKGFAKKNQHPKRGQNKIDGGGRKEQQ